MPWRREPANPMAPLDVPCEKGGAASPEALEALDRPGGDEMTRTGSDALAVACILVGAAGAALATWAAAGALGAGPSREVDSAAVCIEGPTRGPTIIHTVQPTVRAHQHGLQDVVIPEVGETLEIEAFPSGRGRR